MNYKVILVSKNPVLSAFFAEFLRKNPVLGLKNIGDTETTPFSLRVKSIFAIIYFYLERYVSNERLIEWAGKVLSDQASKYPEWPFPIPVNIPGSDRRYANDGGGWIGRLKTILAKKIVENAEWLADPKPVQPDPIVLAHAEAINTVFRFFKLKEEARTKERWQSVLKKLEEIGFLEVPPPPINDDKPE